MQEATGIRIEPSGDQTQQGESDLVPECQIIAG